MAEVIVDEFQTVLEAQEALEVLLQAGVSGRVQARATGGLDQYLNAAGSWCELWVLERDLDKARPVVAAFRADVEKHAAEAEQAALEESGAEADAIEPERQRELPSTAKLGGRLFQIHGVIALISSFAMHRNHYRPELTWLALPALFDIGIGEWVRSGGVNAARLGTVRLWFAAMLFGVGALMALPDRRPLFSVAPLLVLTASMMMLWWRAKRELGTVLFGLYVVLFVAASTWH
jgi:hypothetical protein